MVKRLPFPLTCAGEVIRTPLGIAAIVIGALFAVVVWNVIPSWFARYEHVGTMITSASVISVDPDKPAYALAVKAEVLVSANCRRVTHFALANTATRQVFPLGMTFSGAGFSPPWQGVYNVVLSIPPAIERGEYRLTVQALYDCEWLGLFRSQIVQQSQISNIMVP